jgi:putative transposase
MQMWKSVSSRQLAAALNIAPPIWQPEYFDRYLRSRENYAQKWELHRAKCAAGGIDQRRQEWLHRGSIFDLMW